MFLHKTNFLLKALFPKNALYRIPLQKKTIYLTFDDGPIPEITEWVLDILEQKKINATFFCIGENIKKHPKIFERILNQNHMVGNHTFNHLKGWSTDAEVYKENTLLCEDYLPPATYLFRPPYGRITKKQAELLQEKKYRIVMWDVLSGDFEKSVSPETCLKKCIKYTENGSIVVFHDSIKAAKNLKYTLPKYIDFCLKEGYEFKTLENENK